MQSGVQSEKKWKKKKLLLWNVKLHSCHTGFLVKKPNWELFPQKMVLKAEVLKGYQDRTESVPLRVMCSTLLWAFLALNLWYHCGEIRFQPQCLSVNSSTFWLEAVCEINFLSALNHIHSSLRATLRWSKGSGIFLLIKIFSVSLCC